MTEHNHAYASQRSDYERAVEETGRMVEEIANLTATPAPEQNPAPDAHARLLQLLMEKDDIIRILRGALAAQDEREDRAGKLCGVPRQGSCDWPDDVAQEVLALRAEGARRRAVLIRVAQVVLNAYPVRHSSAPWDYTKAVQEGYDEAMALVGAALVAQEQDLPQPDPVDDTGAPTKSYQDWIEEDLLHLAQRKAERLRAGKRTNG